MKKTLIGLGLVGVLSVLGPQVNALEIKTEGFKLPEKYKLAKEIKREHKKLGNSLIGTWVDYKHEDGSGYRKVLMNDLIWWYVIFPKKHDDYSQVYGIADNNCDGIFETKYDNKEEVEWVTVIPPCYYEAIRGT